MPTTEQPFTTALRKALSGAGAGGTLYALLDGARVPKLWVMLEELKLEHVPLFRESPKEDITHVTPFLARIDPQGVAPEWLTFQPEALENAIFLTSSAALDALLAHFRRYLLVHDSGGKDVYFRFYDSRVLPIFLEAITPAEARGFFGPVSRFFVRDPDSGTAEAPVAFKGWNLPPEARGLAEPPPPDVHRPFHLRPEVEAAFSQAAMDDYDRRAVQYLRGKHGALLSKSSDDDVLAIVNRAKALGPELGLPSGRDATRLAELLVLGFTQETRRQLLETPMPQRPRKLEEIRDQAGGRP